MRTLAIFFLSLLTSAAALAQPRIRYMFPDIGAPGMNTYVEIMGPANLTGNFGNTDKLYDNNDNALRVEPATAADAQYLVVGPHVVSWLGRMVSTQVFVKPNTPPGTYNLVVILNGNRSANIPFTVVVPTAVNLNGGGVLGNGFPAGVRSPRGAMIVSSLTLGAGTYTVSTVDRDPVAAGEQGWLPLVLISQGPVTIASGATIQLDATGATGAPGGGGGGGQVCDAAIQGSGASGTAGGTGYTGGSGGGRNNAGAIGGSDVNQPDGAGTGVGDSSMNGAVGGRQLPNCRPESAGGGTGHPFGDGGEEGCGGTFRGAAGHGGAGGAADNSQGAGGGYSTNGGSGGGNGGLQHGNRQGVPVAGGSGGSSGNPRGPSTCAGAGGGGGGALALYSQTSMNIAGQLTARGANGGAGSQTGGGGSGGMIIVGAKDSNSVGGTLVTPGGTGGGAGSDGRTRYDGFLRVGMPGIVPTSISAGSGYIGPTIDTLTYVRRRTFTLYGTQDPDADVRIWIRGDNAYTTWTNLTVPPTNVTRVGRRWSFQITLPAGGYYYIVAGQFVPTPSEVPYNREPIWVLSQSAANIIYADIKPEIEGDRIKYFGTVGCDRSVIDSFRVWNNGDEDLVIQTPTPNPAGAFTVLMPPNYPLRLQRGDTAWIKVRFTPTTPGIHRDSITFPNNDPRTIQGEPRPRAQWQVVFQGRKLRIEPSLSQRTLDMPPVCPDSTMTQELEYRFQGDTASFIRSITRLGPGTARFSIVLPTSFPTAPIVNGNGTIPIRVRFSGAGPGTYVDSFRVIASPCDTPLVFTVRITVVDMNIEVTPNPLAFGPVRANTTAMRQVTITNRGNTPVTVGNVFWRPGHATLRVPTDPAGRVLAPGGSTTFDVEFRPTTTQSVAAVLCVETIGVCRDTVCIDVTGEGITSLLVLSRRAIELHADSCVNEPGEVVDTFRLTNRGLAPEDVTSVTAMGGLVTVTSVPPLPPTISLAPDASIEFTVRWLPSSFGVRNEVIRITTTSADPAQRILNVDVRLVHELSRIALFENDDTLRAIDFGTTFQCDSTAERAVEVRSLGTLDEPVTASFARGTGFEVLPSPDWLVARGGSVPLRVRFTPSANGEYFDTLIVRSRLCEKEVRIPLTGRYVGLSYNAGGISFGQSNVGVTVTGSAFLSYEATPLNTTKTVVETAYIEQTGSAFSITRLPLPDTLAPGEMTSVEVGFNPAAEQAYSARLCFVLSEPCRDTICVPLTGEGIRANLLVRQTTLNFGPKFVCQDTTLDLTIENTGSAPVEIQDIRLTGPDAAAFERVTPFTPFTMAPGGTATYTFRFIPARSPLDGMKTATVEIVSNDPTRSIITVTLIGERRSQALATPAALDFGSVPLGTYAEMDLVIESRTPTPLRIQALRVPPPYQVISPATPLTIPPFGSITVRVRFTPTDTLDASAILVAEHTEPCVDSTFIPLTGRGREIKTAVVTLQVPTGLTGAPGDRVPIPLVMTSASQVAESEVTTLVATLRFDRELLFPIGARAKGQPLAKPGAALASAARIVSSSVQGTQRVVTVEIINQPMPASAPDTVGFLDVTAMLTDHVSTPVVIDTAYFTDGPAVVTTVDGSFTLEGYCEIDSNRFVRISGASGLKSVSPNPFTSSVEIIFETSENGPTSLRLLALDGRAASTIVDQEHLDTGVHRRVLAAEGLPSGTYLLELRTPTERHVQRVVVLR